MDKNLQDINLVIVGRNYPVSVSESELPAIKNIVQEINKNYDNLRQQYAGKIASQDILVMMLMTYAKELYELQDQNLDLKLLGESIDHLDELLDHVLQNKNK